MFDLKPFRLLSHKGFVKTSLISMAFAVLIHQARLLFFIVGEDAPSYLEHIFTAFVAFSFVGTVISAPYWRDLLKSEKLRRYAFFTFCGIHSAACIPIIGNNLTKYIIISQTLLFAGSLMTIPCMFLLIKELKNEVQKVRS